MLRKTKMVTVKGNINEKTRMQISCVWKAKQDVEIGKKHSISN